jgi:SAM-dependent methyltransferase
MARLGEGAWTNQWVSDVRRLTRIIRVQLDALRYQNLSTQEIFERIYGANAWGTGNGGDFDSGSGSGKEFVQAYVDAISAYVHSHSIRSIVDLGCGDFRVAQNLLNCVTVEYTGCDVVRPLIEHHRRANANAQTQFMCLDIIKDSLPSGDLYLIRQVLQHLSNAQIATILDKLQDQRVIVTEHVCPGAPVRPNRDKAAGPDIRLYYGSGVYLEYPPFNRQSETLLEVAAPFNGRDAVLRTSLILPRCQ